MCSQTYFPSKGLKTGPALCLWPDTAVPSNRNILIFRLSDVFSKPMGSLHYHTCVFRVSLSPDEVHCDVLFHVHTNKTCQCVSEVVNDELRANGNDDMMFLHSFGCSHLD